MQPCHPACQLFLPDPKFFNTTIRNSPKRSSCSENEKSGTENSVTETAALDSKGESDIANPVERTGIPKVTVQDHKKKLIVQVISLMRMAKPKI